jgi:hypothetical protein
MLTILAALVVGAFLGYALGAYWSGKNARRALGEAEARYAILRRDFELISAANVQLLGRHGAQASSAAGAQERQRFFDLYDEAKRCLHRAL